MLKRENIIKYQHEIILFFILIFAIAIWSYEITLPYVKIWESGYQDIIAKNHIKYGFENTRFLITLNNIDGHLVHRFNHPPLFQVYVALSYMIFGIHEWSARLVPIFFSAAGIVLIYAITSKIYDKRIGLISLTLAAFFPISSYFGRIVNFESCVLFFGLLTVYLHLIIDENPSKINKLFFIATVILGALSDWPFMILFGLLTLYSLFFYKSNKNNKNCLISFFIVMMVLGLYLAINFKVTGTLDIIGRFSDYFQVQQRSDENTYQFIIKLFELMFQRTIKYFTMPAIIASICGLILLFSKKYNQNTSNIQKHIYLFIFLFWGTLYILLLPQSAFFHDYALYYMIPGVSISAALFINIFADMRLNKISVGKYVMTCLILVIIIPSLIQTYDIHHSNITFNAYNAGLFIKNHTSSNDLIAVDSTIIAYYSDRNFVGLPAAPQPIIRLNQTRPEIVEFWKHGDKNFSEYTNYLLSSNYKLIYDDNGWQIWKLDKNIYYDFVSNFDSANTSYNFTNESHKRNYIKTLSYSIHNRTLTSIYQHPLADAQFIQYKVKIPDNSFLNFSIVHSIEKGDGIIFEIYLNDSVSVHKIFSEYIGRNNDFPSEMWHDFEIPLSEYSDKNVTISFVTSSGPINDTSYDWAYWGEPKIVVKMPNNNSAP